MHSYHIYQSPFPIPRGPLLVLVKVLTIVVFVLRAFLSIPSEKMRERREALVQIKHDFQPKIWVCLEITADYFAVLKERNWFTRYHLIPPDAVSEEEHFAAVVTLIRDL